MASEAISPWMSRIVKSLQPTQLNGGLTPEEDDGILEGLAKQTIQPYRSGWAALPGVAASLVGGAASAQLANRRHARAAADDKVLRALSGIDNKPAPVQTTAETPSPTTTTTAPITPKPTAADKGLTPDQRYTSGANTQLGSSTPAQQTVIRPSSISQRLNAELKRLESASQLPMSARARRDLLARIDKVKQAQLQQSARDEQWQRGAADRDLNRRYKLAQIRKLEQKVGPKLIEEYKAAVEHGAFKGTIVDWVKLNKGGGQSSKKDRMIQLYDLAVQQGYKGTIREFLQEQLGLKQKAQGNKMTATIQKMIGEADDLVNANRSAINTLNEAIKLNSNTLTGPYAQTRAWLGQYTGDEGSQNTIQLDNIIKTQALSSLKAIFGGMPTEGERKILLELQGSVDQTPDVREQIYRRALRAAKRRLAWNVMKGRDIRSGAYFRPGYVIPDFKDEADQQGKFRVIRRHSSAQRAAAGNGGAVVTQVPTGQ